MDYIIYKAASRNRFSFHSYLPERFCLFVVSLMGYKSMVQINLPKVVQTRTNQLNRISLLAALSGDESQQPALAFPALLPKHILLLPKVAIYLSPLAVLVCEFCAFEGFVDEVAALAVEAVPVEHEGEAGARLVGVIVGHVVAQFAGAVGELALVAVGAEALVREIPAQ